MSNANNLIEETRAAMIAAGSLPLLAGVGMNTEVSDRVAEGTLACLSSFCSPKYYQLLKDSFAITAIVSRLTSNNNVVSVKMLLFCVFRKCHVVLFSL
jgi:hypothetical protein